MALTREQIVRTAVDLLDKVGLEGLTLRRLATELGISAPTLYWHVRHKRELLDLMSTAIVAESGMRRGTPEPGQPWWEWLAQETRSQFDALLRHRDGALVVAGNRPTESVLPLVEETIGSLVAVGFTARDALRALLALGHYTIGCAVEYQAEAARALIVDSAPARDLSQLPALAAAAAAGAGGDGPDGAFQHGLALLITGLRATVPEDG